MRESTTARKHNTRKETEHYLYPVFRRGLNSRIDVLTLLRGQTKEVVDLTISHKPRIKNVSSHLHFYHVFEQNISNGTSSIKIQELNRHCRMKVFFNSSTVGFNKMKNNSTGSRYGRKSSALSVTHGGSRAYKWPTLATRMEECLERKRLEFIFPEKLEIMRRFSVLLRKKNKKRKGNKRAVYFILLYLGVCVSDCSLFEAGTKKACRVNCDHDASRRIYVEGGNELPATRIRICYSHSVIFEGVTYTFAQNA
ncbi:hypothetical protein WN51_07763 [Melipona quadrifasciata]|uniref:Uncharacterized protein n=1 Tax=Melipona quadrifasciata TaxID=166423 RepID=A0A0M9A6Q7_9HYME|nr:hypothetical protein WN51_07763 [Melipona quadrifasciata]